MLGSNRSLTARNNVQEIMEKGYDQKIQSFVMHYDCDTLDAATLILPLVFFISPTDPRMLATIKCIDRSPDKVRELFFH